MAATAPPIDTATTPRGPGARCSARRLHEHRDVPPSSVGAGDRRLSRAEWPPKHSIDQFSIYDYV